MKTIKEIIENYSEYEGDANDMFGARLCQFLTEDEMKKIGFKFVNKFGRPRDIKAWTKSNVLEQLQEAVESGFEYARAHRNMGSTQMFHTVKAWNKVLENGLDKKDEYEKFSLSLFNETAKKYGWERPVAENYG